ncbi:hypothetical protein TNCT_177061 [Trichonephila clavata]|uniref:Uncharacterized protein n=1 Tax=Trichonephila clavata TaxID=2740835 RepID=A0A8X6J0T6_TRICU|nr:hypothetical protein TNCT_177061 [Trichonephila clavata]
MERASTITFWVLLDNTLRKASMTTQNKGLLTFGVLTMLILIVFSECKIICDNPKETLLIIFPSPTQIWSLLFMICSSMWIGDEEI